MNIRRTRVFLFFVVCIALRPHTAAWSETPANFQKANLVAWCIVPFDANQRGPAERAEMLAELGLKRCAYDWRAKHVPEFEDEILQYAKRGIEFFAFWGAHEDAFRLFETYDLHPQIWQTNPSPGLGSDEANVRAAVKRLMPLAERTKQLGCTLALYNHGGWGGQPENLVAVCKRFRELGFDHVGVVYNFHHAHDVIDRWPAAFAILKPYLTCLNLNGMNPDAQPKIVPLGEGKHEAEMIRIVLESDYDGPIGLLDHRSEADSKLALQANLRGLRRVMKKLGRDAESF
jgi:sugar phosphate isomerase/epimerase